ncbi:MAG: chitobiase/beta-hexosaminidase C-terminal domain-containing protein, partial [Planctomycetales bacterium]|nr:chitobiase/beta-hexosaminidase C-terminal domain-containing protein [Planctomycetales bacterium]
MRKSLPRRSSQRLLKCERLESRELLAVTDLRITEFLASNANGLRDVDGDTPDWIEIYNAGVDAVDMAGVHLTDDADELSKWTFPAGVTLSPGQYLVVFASGKDGVLGSGELHASFAISAGGEYLALVAADGVTIVDEFSPEFPGQFQDVSYGVAMAPSNVTATLVAEGAIGAAWAPTSSVYDSTWTSVEFDDAAFNYVGPTGFGYENSPGAATNYVDEIRTNVPSGTESLYLRVEFALDDLVGIDELTLGMRYDDGFVAYLNGVRIAEANAPEAVQWNSRAVASHADGLAESYLSFDVSAAIPHLKAGANVLAIHALNVRQSSDMLSSPILTATSAEIVFPEKLGYFENPTPGYANGVNFSGFLDRPAMSASHGFYDAPQSIVLSTSVPDALIVYTTDGSAPTVDANLNIVNGSAYAAPIFVGATTTIRALAVREDYKPSAMSAATYVFLDDVLDQSPQGQIPVGWPASGVNGQAMDYGMDPDILALYGEEAVKESLLSLPSISISTDLANLFNPQTGIFVNAVFDGRDWERPASVELLNPDGTLGFSVNAGLRIRGGYSRNDFNPKHAFRFYFRGEYGDSRLEFPLFGDEGPDEFDVVDLRTAQNYSWSSEGNVQNTFVREVFGRDLQRDMGEPYTRSRYYHLYLDGQYWGVFQTQERVEEFYAETYFGGDAADYDIVKHGLNDGGGTLVNEGNDVAWRRLFDLAQAMADNPTANADNYYTMQGLNADGTRNPELPVLLDVDNVVHYAMVLFFTGGFDSGISRFLGDNEANNWYGVYNRVAADQGFQFFIHDNEHALGTDGSVHGSTYIDRTGPFNNGNQSNFRYFNPQYLHQDLLVHPAYRQRFNEIAEELFSTGGAMTPEANIARMSERVAQVEPAIIAESARWGDSRVGVPRNQSDWQAEIDWLLGTYFNVRTPTVLMQLARDNLHSPTPKLSLAPGDYPAGTLLELTRELPGTIYYSLDGVTDPRLEDDSINPSPEVQIYSTPIALAGNQTILARFRFSRGGWSALVEASYSVGNAGDYNVDGVVDGLDFLEWQRTFGAGASPPGSGADGDANGTVDSADLLVWEHAFAAPSSADFLLAGSPLATQLDASEEPAGEMESPQEPLADKGFVMSLTLSDTDGAPAADSARGMSVDPAPPIVREEHDAATPLDLPARVAIEQARTHTRNRGRRDDAYAAAYA